MTENTFFRKIFGTEIFSSVIESAFKYLRISLNRRLSSAHLVLLFKGGGSQIAVKSMTHGLGFTILYESYNMTDLASF